MSFVRLTVVSTLVFALSAVVLAQPASRTDDAPALHNWPVAFRASEALIPEANALPSAASHFIEMAPCRVYDSRVVAGGPGPIPSASARTVAIAGGPCAGVPSNAAGFSVNITVTDSASSSSYAFLTAYPTGTTRPNAATVNFKAGTQVGNAAIVPAGTGGAIDIYVSLQTEVIVDINGYFAEGVVTSVVAGTGLSGGGTGAVNLSIADGGVGVAQLSATGSTSGQVLTSNGASVLWQTPTVSGAAGGDLSGTYPNPAVAAVGGQSAASVAYATMLANAATSANTPGMIVMRGVNGDFAAGSVTLAGNLALPATVSSSEGVITLGTTRYLHGYGFDNTFLGQLSGNFTMTGSENTAVGSYSLLLNGTGSYNTAIGYQALPVNTTGNYNTALGMALYTNSTGGSNTALGSGALYVNSSGTANTAVGFNAAATNNNGNFNTAVGYGTLGSTTGHYNTVLGTFAGANLTSGSHNLAIDNAAVSTDSGTIRIGNSADHTRTFIAGIRDVTTANADAVLVLIDSAGQLGTASSSRRYKSDILDMGQGTDALMRLRPVTFRYLAHGEDAPLQYGLIAEEVADVYPDLVTRDGEGRPETVRYQFLAPMLLNEVQKDRRVIEQQQKAIDSLEQRIAALEGAIGALKRTP